MLRDCLDDPGDQRRGQRRLLGSCRAYRSRDPGHGRADGTGLTAKDILREPSKGSLGARDQARRLSQIVRRDGEHVRLYSRKAIDWTERLPAIAEGAVLLKAKSFTLDGEAVVVL